MYIPGRISFNIKFMFQHKVIIPPDAGTGLQGLDVFGENNMKVSCDGIP